jgi:hypothetical protein
MFTDSQMTSEEYYNFIKELDTLTSHHDLKQINRLNEQEPGRFINLILVEDGSQPNHAPAKKVIQSKRLDRIHTKEELIAIYKRITEWVETNILRLGQENRDQRLHSCLCRLLYVATCLQAPDLTDHLSSIYSTLFPINVPLYDDDGPLEMVETYALVNKPVDKALLPLLYRSGLHQKFAINETVVVWRESQKEYRHGVVVGYDRSQPNFVGLFKRSNKEVYAISDFPLKVLVNNAGSKHERLYQRHYCDSRATIGRVKTTDYHDIEQGIKEGDPKQEMSLLGGILAELTVLDSIKEHGKELKSLASYT